jgi:hypothetical protein
MAPNNARTQTAASGLRRSCARGGGTHLLWGAGGILVYGAGTFAGGWITLLGWMTGNDIREQG